MRMSLCVCTVAIAVRLKLYCNICMYIASLARVVIGSVETASCSTFPFYYILLR